MTLWAPVQVQAGAPGAFELLAAAKAAYGELATYGDRGVIEEVGADGVARPVARFETAALAPSDAGGGTRDVANPTRLFRLALLGPDDTETAAVWTTGGEAFAWDAGSGAWAAIGADGPAAVRRLLPATFDALVVPALLAGDGAALDFEAASFDGAEPCPGGAGAPAPAAASASGDGAGRGIDRCVVVSAIRMSGGLEYRLWLDAGSRLVRRVELVAYPAEAILGRAAAEAGLAPPQPAAGGPPAAAAAEPRTWRVTHEVLDAATGLASPGLPAAPGQPATAPATAPAAPAVTADLFAPPAGARRVAASDLAAPAAAAPPSAAAAGTEGDPRATFSERIEVRRIELEVRALDPSGQPLSGLGPGDFQVVLGGEEATVESVEWIPTGQDAFSDVPWKELAQAGVTVPPPGRLTVLFVQADMEPSRVAGHLRMLRRVELLFADLQPDDRMAVVSFDSHLRLRQEFTDDRGRLATALEEAVRFGGEAWPWKPGPYPSLARWFDFAEGKRAATPERALELTARALARFPGPKSILYLGWGLGRFDARNGTVSPAPGYEEAREILAEAGIPVFVLDVSDSAAHSLEVGLQQVAEDTGGRYERMAFFPDQAAKRIVKMMGDRYVIVFARPADLPLGEHRLKIELVGRRGTVLAPRTLTDPS